MLSLPPTSFWEFLRTRPGQIDQIDVRRSTQLFRKDKKKKNPKIESTSVCELVATCNSGHDLRLNPRGATEMETG